MSNDHGFFRIAPRRHGSGASNQGRDYGAGDDMYQRRMGSRYSGDNSDRRSYQDLEDANQDSVITATNAPMGKDGCRSYKNDLGMSCQECVKTGKGKNGEVERQNECVGERQVV